MVRDSFVKQLTFINSTLGDPKLFREQTILSLEKIFGYQRCGFWMVDAKGYLYAPVATLSYDENMIKEYEKGYYYYDFLSPSNLGINKALKDEVVLLNQVVKKEELKESKYYNFMQKYYYNEIMTYLKKDNDVIGAISIVRSQDEKDFDQQDIIDLKALTNYLSARLSESMLYEYNENMKNIFMAFTEQSSTGLIIFGKHFTVKYYNEVAQKICKQFGEYNNKLNCVDFFIKNIVANNSFAWVSGMEKTVLLPSFEQITITIMPIENKGCFDKENQLFMVLFKTNTEPQDRRLLNNHETAPYNLSFRELEIVRLVMNGYSNQEIANDLFISLNTVKKHLSQIFAKVKVSNRTSLIYKINSSKNHFDFFDPTKTVQ